MPKNKGKGLKKQRQGKNMRRELVFKEDSQEYAQEMFFLLLNVLQWCAFMNTTPVLLSHSLHTHTHTMVTFPVCGMPFFMMRATTFLFGAYSIHNTPTPGSPMRIEFIS
uniref:Transmembrane protein n=1 Tax=Oncorhynchus kisutch TaxID=8019 RepID=A0A8C7KGN1_ONCKI